MSRYTAGQLRGRGGIAHIARRRLAARMSPLPNIPRQPCPPASMRFAFPGIHATIQPEIDILGRLSANARTLARKLEPYSACTSAPAYDRNTYNLRQRAPIRPRPQRSPRHRGPHLEAASSFLAAQFMCAFIRPASSGGRRTFACRRSAGGGSIRRPARVPWLPRRTRFIDCTLGRLRARRAPIRGLVATRWRSRLLRQLSYRPRGQTRGACSCPTWRVGFPLHTGEFARRTYSEPQSGFFFFYGSP